MEIYGNEVYNIRRTLEKLTNIQQEMLGVMRKPENPVTRVLKFIVLVVGALGIISIVEKIIDLIKGGV